MAVDGVVGRPAGEIYTFWGGVDALRYGGSPADLHVFELGEHGRAAAVRLPVLTKTLRNRD